MNKFAGKKTILALGGIVLSLWFGPSVAAGCDANITLSPGFQPGEAAWNKYCVKVNQTKRRFKLYVPEGYSAGQATTVVFALHGGGSFDSMANFIRYSDFEASADDNNYVVVYMEAFKKQWNDGRTEAIVSDLGDKRQDVTFFNTVLDKIEDKINKANIDKVLVMGMSNGAMMTIRLACQAADRIDGVAVVSAFMHDKQDTQVCSAATAVPIVFIHGAKDGIISKDEGAPIGGRFGNGTRGYTAGESRTLDFWAAINGCSLAGIDKNSQKFDRRKVADVHKYYCSEAMMQYYDVHKGGHDWFTGVVDVAYDLLK